MRWIRFILLALVFGLGGLGLFIPHLAYAETPSPVELLESANQLYEAEQFAEAAELYERLVERGVRDEVVFYNLGNAYFKQGDIGRAILNYKIAQRLSPRDTDIRDNLNLARSQTPDPIERENEALLSQLIRWAQAWLSINEMAVTTLILWFASGGLIIAYMHLRRRKGDWAARLTEFILYLLIACLVFLAGGIFSLGGRLYLEHIRPQAVVLVQEVDVNSGPGSQYVTEFTLHSGAEVSVIEERNRWVRLTLPGGQLQGWVPENTVGLVVSN